MLPSAPCKTDQDARALRERFCLVVLGDDDHAIAEAARALFWHCADHPEYALCRLWPPPEVAAVEAPRTIESQYESRCKACKSLIVPGQPCLWTPGEKGVSCLKCNGVNR